MSKLQEKVYESLSDLDMHKALPGVPILTYADLGKYDSIEQLLPEQRSAVVIFIELATNTGHWACCMRSGKKIMYFCSYGTRVDKSIKMWLTAIKRREYGEDVPFMSYLFNKALADGYDVSFNNFDYQDKKNTSVSTCGRWVISRIKWNMEQKNNSSEAFYKFIKKYSKDHQLSLDLSICELVPM